MAKKNEPEIGAPSVTPQRAIVRLEQRIADLEAFDVTKINERWAADTKALQASIDETLSSAFGHNSVDYRRYAAAKTLDHGPLIMGSREDARQVRQYLTEGKEQAIKLLQQAVRSLKEKIEDSAPIPAEESVPQAVSRGVSGEVFVVHGHEEGPREAVARFLERLGFTPVILHERANQGRTIIEKIEAHSDVGFAVVLLTPDDFGGKVGMPPSPRARQNVILELGYFVGHLGRKRVCALKRGEVETPSDWDGVVYTPFDDNGAWRVALARELQQAGYAVDWNKVMM